MVYDPRSRLTVQEALEHPFVSAYHDPNDEPVGTPFPPGYFDFDRVKNRLNKWEIKQLIWEELKHGDPNDVLVLKLA